MTDHSILRPDTDGEPRRRGLLRVPRPRRAPLRTWLFAHVLLPRLVAGTTCGTLTVRLPDGRELRGGRRVAGQPDARMHVRTPRALSRLATRGQLGLGEAWSAGEINSPDLVALIELLGREVHERKRRGAWRVLATVRARMPHRPHRPGLDRSRRDISYHYDLGNDFYATFLDRSMTYSCGIFEHPGATLEQAQLAKYRRMCEHLRLVPGDHVLEIGCGWGGFAEVAAGEHGVRVTCLTLSTEQAEFARERVRRAGLDHLVEVRLQDYRQVEGTFDKVASIEMLEAVGEREYGTFFRRLDELLAPGGRAAVQTIAFRDREFALQARIEGWVRRYVFPGGMLPTPTVLTREMTRAGDLQLHALEEIGPHYARTLAAWRANVHAHAAALREQGFDETFLRTWDYYLALCEAGFRARIIRTLQLVVTRAGEGAASADEPWLEVPGRRASEQHRPAARAVARRPRGVERAGAPGHG